MSAPAAVSKDQNQAGPPFRLMSQITAYRTSQCIRVAVDLGLAARLEPGPVTAAELAQATGTREDPLERVLAHLANEDIIGRADDGRYRALAVTAYLDPDHPRSLAAWVACELDPLLWRSWERLPDQLRSGTTAFELAHDAPFFERHARDEAAQKRFDDQMGGASRGIGAVVVQNMRFDAGTRLVDVGGGNGAFLAQLLERNPGTEGTLFDLPRSDGRLAPDFEALVHSGRASHETGSFFESVPAGADVYLFSRVFHDFDDTAVRRILDTTRRALTGRERLFLIEIISGETPADARGTSQDIFMLAQLGGRERSAQEFSALLSASGFEMLGVTPTPSPVSIIEFCCAND